MASHSDDQFTGRSQDWKDGYQAGVDTFATELKNARDRGMLDWCDTCNDRRDGCQQCQQVYDNPQKLTEATQMDGWNELEQRLQAIRDALDNADGTPLGKIGKLLDTMTTDADRAISTAKALRASAPPPADYDNWGRI